MNESCLFKIGKHDVPSYEVGGASCHKREGASVRMYVVVNGILEHSSVVLIE
jgi:hypothetical protein